MHARGVPHESRVGGRDLACAVGGVRRFPDTDERPGTGQPGVVDHPVAIGVECRIGEVNVTVREGRHDAPGRPGTPNAARRAPCCRGWDAAATLLRPSTRPAPGWPRRGPCPPTTADTCARSRAGW